METNKWWRFGLNMNQDILLRRALEFSRRRQLARGPATDATGGGPKAVSSDG
jgi:hypothetical protein